METELLTTSETSRVIEVTPATVRWYANTNKLRAIRTRSGVRFFLRQDVERFAAERAARKSGGEVKGR